MVSRVLGVGLGILYLVYAGSNTSAPPLYGWSILCGLVIGVVWSCWVQVFFWNPAIGDFSRRPAELVGVLTMPMVGLSLYIGLWILNVDTPDPWGATMITSAFIEVLLYTWYREYHASKGH